MIRLRALIWRILEPKQYLWIGAILIRETPRAILIMFDGRKAWIPKAWIARIKRNGGMSIKIKISEYGWAKNF